jgi:hypothetical protein
VKVTHPRRPATLGYLLKLSHSVHHNFGILGDDPGRGSVFGGAMAGTQLVAIGLVVAGGLIWWLRPGAKAVPAQTVGATR